MLKGHKVIHEADDHFVVQKPDGKAMRVAKGALKHSTVEKIRGYAMGGEVGGEEAPPEPLTEQQLQDAETLRMLGPDTPGPGPVTRALSSILPVGAPGQAGDAARPPPEPTAVAAIPDVPAPQVAPTPVAPVGKPAPSYKPAGVPGAFADAEAQTEAGIHAAAGAKGAEAIEAQKIQAEDVAKRVALADSFQATMAEHVRRSDELFNAAASAKIDPDHYWANKGTGQKIASTISLILGGLGAGLTRGPNYALDSLNKAIDMDMEAQRINLGKQQGLLSHYMQQGRELQTAYGLAKADQLDITAGKMIDNALKFGNPKAQAEAQLAVGALRERAAVLRQQAEQHELALQSTKAGGAWQSMVSGALGASLGARPGEKPPSAAKVMLMSTFLGKPDELAKHQFRIPEEVPVGTDKSGQPRFQRTARTVLAATPDDAKAAKTALLTSSEQEAKLRNLEVFLKQHPSGAWSPADKQQIDTLTKDFDLSWNKGQEGLNRVNEVELKMVNDMRGNPGGFWSSISGKDAAAFKALRGAINNRRQGIVEAYQLE